MNYQFNINTFLFFIYVQQIEDCNSKWIINFSNKIIEINLCILEVKKICLCSFLDNCTLKHKFITGGPWRGSRAGMSNWRPHCLFNAARRDLFCSTYDQKLLNIKKLEFVYLNKSSIIHINLKTFVYFTKKFHLNINKINNFLAAARRQLFWLQNNFCGPQSVMSLTCLV